MTISTTATTVHMPSRSQIPVPSTGSSGRAKFYRLTKAGERNLQQEERHWRRTVLVIASVLEST